MIRRRRLDGEGSGVPPTIFVDSAAGVSPLSTFTPATDVQRGRDGLGRLRHFADGQMTVATSKTKQAIPCCAGPQFPFRIG